MKKTVIVYGSAKFINLTGSHDRLSCEYKIGKKKKGKSLISQSKKISVFISSFEIPFDSSVMSKRFTTERRESIIKIWIFFLCDFISLQELSL